MPLFSLSGLRLCSVAAAASFIAMATVVAASFTPETVVISVADHTIVGRVPQASPFCPNIAATPDGTQVWCTLKDTGKTEVFNAQPPFNVLKGIDTGPITNHVNIVRNAHGQFAYVTIGGLNEVKAFRTDDFSLVATIPVGKLPHGIWPSGDGTRVYIGLEIDDNMTAIGTLTNKVIATSPIGQAAQGVAYVPDAVPESTGPELGNNAMSSAGAGMPAAMSDAGAYMPGPTGTGELQPLGLAGEAAHYLLTMAPPGAAAAAKAPTSLSLYDQGLVQVLEASVAGLEPKHPYLLAFSERSDGGGKLEPLEGFMTNPAGAAIVNAVGPIRQIVQGAENTPRRRLVIVPGSAAQPGQPVQILVL